MKYYFYVSLFLCSSFSLKAQTDSLDIKIGQMIMIGMLGNHVTDSDEIMKDIKKGLVGGVLLFEYNINPSNSEKNLATMTTMLQQASHIPLFISIDQEGGQVNRLKTKYGFKPMPSAKSVALKHDDSYAHEIGNTIATTLLHCGINVNYAPVLDFDNPNCPVLGKRNRCYSNQVDEIVHYASITIQEHRKQQIKTVVKHFPGHGNSLTDSHLGLADVTKGWTQDELKPYKQLMDSDLVDAIMTAHIINRNLDSTGVPATLSKRIITGILRNLFHFKGVVFSDDMQMHAISSYYGFEESIKKGINAGLDVLVFSNNIKEAKDYTPKNIHATIKKLVLNGSISRTRIDESFARIMAMKQSL